MRDNRLDPKKKLNCLVSLNEIKAINIISFPLTGKPNGYYKGEA